jgi:hypothetical protein
LEDDNDEEVDLDDDIKGGFHIVLDPIELAEMKLVKHSDIIKESEAVIVQRKRMLDVSDRTRVKKSNTVKFDQNTNFMTDIKKI